MALFSVWNYPRNIWAIYSTPNPVSVGDDPVPPRPERSTPLGASPDVDVKPLPSGAKFLGYDHLARGEVRRMSAGLGDTGDDGGLIGQVTKDPTTTFLVGAGAGAFAMWLLKKIL